MEGSLCTQILPPAPATPAQALALAPTPRGSRAAQGSRVFGEQNKFSASRYRLCSQVRRGEGEGRGLQHQHSPARSCSRAKHTGPSESGQHMISGSTTSCCWAVLQPHQHPLHGQRTTHSVLKGCSKFIRCHCTGFQVIKTCYQVCFQRA